MPRGVWHANVTPDLGGLQQAARRMRHSAQGLAASPVQALCLGPQVDAGTPLKEIVLRTYGALSMQSVQIDERDSAGIMNLDAARWWQANLERIPLSREAFLSPVGEEV